MAERRGPMRLLFLINDARFFVTHILPLARAAVTAGYDTHVALPFEGAALDMSDALSAIRACGAQLHDLPIRRGGMAWMGELAALSAILRLMAHLRPDILHAITIKPVLYGGLAARLLRTPRVIFFITGLGHVFIAQGFRAALVRRLVMRAYRMVLRNRRGLTVFENEEDSSLFTAAHLVQRDHTILIRGCGVDSAVFYPATIAPPEPPVVLLPARLQHEKGVREFVAAAQLLRTAGVKVRMAMVGYADFDRPGGVGEDELRGWCENGLVEWWGHSTTMPDTLRQAHIVCLPSYREGFPKTLIEAAATGLPVVTCDVPGCRDAVRPGETGLLAPPRNAAALADAIARLLDDPALRASMGIRGRDMAVKEHSLERFVNANLALYARPPA
ncbi:MAG: glycosyltransferase family 1 protein [Alphaproteobacteria bacterium]|nr:glycosyltransferase family 1 protein [Alphaproteobacteria bacterium]